MSADGSEKFEFVKVKEEFDQEIDDEEIDQEFNVDVDQEFHDEEADHEIDDTVIKMEPSEGENPMINTENKVS